LAVLFSAAPTVAQTESYTESTDVVAVEVPVQVLDHGRPVRGLKAEDFALFEGRDRLKLTGFEVVDLSQGEPAARAAARPLSARRHFLLLFDMGFSQPSSLAKGRTAALELLDHLHPTDLVAVATYSPALGARLLLGFTPDLAQVRGALDRLGTPQVLARALDPLRLVVDLDINPSDAPPGPRGPGSGREGRSERIQDAMETALAKNPAPPDLTGFIEEREKQRADVTDKQKQVEAMSRSIGELARMMAAVQGRKYVVLLSEGFDASLMQGSADFDEQSKIQEQARSATQYIFVDDDKRFGSSQVGAKVLDMVDQLRRADCVVETVDIGGVHDGAGANNQFAGGKDSLFLIADSTGGEMFDNSNDLSASLVRMLDRTSVTYLLTFQPENLIHNGVFHPLRVELRHAPRGVQILHRQGYYAPLPYNSRPRLEKSLEAAQQVLRGQDAGSIRAEVLAAAFAPGTAGTEQAAYVPVVLEVDGPSLIGSGIGGMESKLPAEIYVYAMDERGAVRGFLSQTVDLDLDKVEPALRQAGLKFFGHLDLPPGSYSLRVLVRNGATGAIGARVSSLQVPAFAELRPVLLPPFFPETPGKWLVVREAARQGEREVPYPFMAGEQPYIPASKPELAPEQEAQLALVGYHLAPGSLSAEARILTLDGRDAGAGSIRVTGRAPDPADGSERLAASFRPPRLAPGEYLLRITVTAPAGTPQTSTAPFVVARKENS
jgi:VWFA-related protein